MESPFSRTETYVSVTRYDEEQPGDHVSVDVYCVKCKRKAWLHGDMVEPAGREKAMPACLDCLREIAAADTVGRVTLHTPAKEGEEQIPDSVYENMPSFLRSPEFTQWLYMLMAHRYVAYSCKCPTHAMPAGHTVN